MDSESLYDEHDEAVDSGYPGHIGCDMKTLFFIRHAKSSWDDTVLPDRDRPLNDRGERDVAKMGKRLVERNVKADLIMSSPAKRARDSSGHRQDAGLQAKGHRGESSAVCRPDG